MIQSSATDIALYTTAGEIANIFHANTSRLRELANEMTECSEKLKQTCGTYAIELHYLDRGYSIDTIIDKMKRCTWAHIIEKLGIRKLMSAERQKQLDSQLGLYQQRYCGDTAQDVPDITEEMIRQVVSGFAQSVPEFMDEAIKEEYDFWKWDGSHRYKTNDFFRLGRRIVRQWVCREGYGRYAFSLNYDNARHVRAIDHLFHRLDGKGVPEGHDGPLCDAINLIDKGKNSCETDYFKVRCFKNHNIHLTFKRLDLLDLFNRAAGRMWLRANGSTPEQAAATVSTLLLTCQEISA